VVRACAMKQSTRGAWQVRISLTLAFNLMEHHSVVSNGQ
jgi:hypothetical protein